jgi:nucleotide-binding universal stress UspA family protein
VRSALVPSVLMPFAMRAYLASATRRRKEAPQQQVSCRPLYQSAIVRSKRAVLSDNQAPEMSVNMPTPIDSAPPFIATVVHPTDFSPASERAFAHALAVAVVRRAQLTILHVAADGRPDWDEFPSVRATLERWGLLGPGSSRDAVFERLGVKLTKRTISGRSPARAVVDYLDESPADLLVVATEGRDDGARWRHGSVAEAMARDSKTMTLFVPSQADRGFVSPGDTVTVFSTCTSPNAARTVTLRGVVPSLRTGTVM